MVDGIGFSDGWDGNALSFGRELVWNGSSGLGRAEAEVGLDQEMKRAL